MKTIRVGFVGAGWVATNRHLPALKQVPDVTLQAVWSRSSEKAEAAAREFGIGRVAATWQEVAQAPDVDAVVVATPPVLHHAASIAALAAGKHVLCQGRMARTLDEAREMAQAAQQSGRVAALYPPRPGLKGDRVVQRLLREGYVGDIREVRVTSIALAPEPTGYAWTGDPTVVGIHTLTLGMWAEVLNRWVGSAARVMAFGQVHRSRRRTQDGEWVQAAVPDSLAVAAELACGATASYHFAGAAAFGPGHSIEIYGSKGALVYQLFAEELRGATEGDKALQPIAIAPDEERQHTTDAEFIRAIREGTPVSPTFADGVAYMAFCQAVADSLQSGTSVAVATA